MRRLLHWLALATFAVLPLSFPTAPAAAPAPLPREWPGAAREAQRSAELAKLQGDWRVVKVERDGRARPSISGTYHLVFSRKALYLKANPHEFHDPYFDFTIEPGKVHGAIDLSDPEGTAFAGIYQVDGDDLMICWNTTARG